jgi:hypothetical protein
MERITFRASLPPIGSAINLSGQEGDGARIKLDVPGSDFLEILKLSALKGKPLKVTVEVDEA